MQKCYIIFNSHFILYQEEFVGLDVRTFLPLCFHSCGLKLASPLALRDLDNTLLTTDLYYVGKWCWKLLLVECSCVSVNAVKKSTQELQPQQEQQKTVWQVCFSWILGPSIVDRKCIFWGEDLLFSPSSTRRPWQENANQEVSRNTISPFLPRTPSLFICFNMQTKLFRDEERDG